MQMFEQKEGPFEGALVIDVNATNFENPLVKNPETGNYWMDEATEGANVYETRRNAIVLINAFMNKTWTEDGVTLTPEEKFGVHFPEIIVAPVASSDSYDLTEANDEAVLYVRCGRNYYAGALGGAMQTVLGALKCDTAANLLFGHTA